MMLRTIATAALAAALSPTGLAHAAPPVCNLIKDDAGDAEAFSPTSDEAMDIVTADVASDAKIVTAVIRLKKYSALDANAPAGRRYFVHFKVPGLGNPIYFSAALDTVLDPLNGTSYTYGQHIGAYATGSYHWSGNATGLIDEAKSEIHISVPVADLSRLAAVKPGTKLSSLRARATFVLGAVGYGFLGDADHAESAKAYVAGTRSCVLPGK